MQRRRGVTGEGVNAVGINLQSTTNPSDEKADHEMVQLSWEYAIKWHDPASCDTGSEPKRAKGVEPDKKLINSTELFHLFVSGGEKAVLPRSLPMPVDEG